MLVDDEVQMTYGQKAVGVSFNPSNKGNVNSCKKAYANIIDGLNDAREKTEDFEERRMLSIAITEAQTSCMWAVKALTWNS